MWTRLISFLKLSLLVAPYSMVQLTFDDRLWSLIYSPFYFFFLFFFQRKKEEGIYWWFLEWPILNARTRGISRLALFLNKGVASSPMHFSSYLYLTSSLISLISSLLILRERARHFENFASVILLTSSPLLSSFYWGSHFSRNRLLTS